MRHEDLNPLPDDAHSEQLVTSLAGVKLRATCTRRDELMYLCGRASASARNDRGSGARFANSKGWLAAAAVVLAFVSGGLTGRALPDASHVAAETQSKSPRVGSRSQESLTSPPKNPTRVAQESMPTHLGKQLRVAMQPAQVEAVLNRQIASSPGRHGESGEAVETIRAASIQQLLSDGST